MKTFGHAVFGFCLALTPPYLQAASDIALSSLAQHGKHHELIAAVESDHKDSQEISSFRLMMLAGSYYEIGKYRDATKSADLLEKHIKSGDASIFGADLSVYPEIIRGAVSLDQGLYDEALRHGTAALAQLKENQLFYRSQLIQISNILGVAYALAGNAAQAKQSLERIRGVDLALSNLGPEKFTAMARIQMALKDFSLALQSINDRNADVDSALTLLYDPTFQNLPRSFIRYKSLFETGQTVEAKRGYDQLLKHPQIDQFGTIYWIALYDRARIALDEGDLTRATELLQKAIDVIEQRRSSIASEVGRIGFVGDKQAVYGQLVELFLRQGRVDEAFNVAERAKSRALVDMLASKQDFAIQGIDRERARHSLEAIDTLNRGILEKVVATEEASLRLRNLNVAHQQLSESAPELASLVSVGTTPSGELRTWLPAGEVLVEYYYFGQNLHAFIFDGYQMRAVKLDAVGLEADIRALRDVLKKVDSDAWQPIAGRLYTRLWQPIDALLGPTQRVLIVAHGALHYLPFAVLRAIDGTLLLERRSLHFLPSASVLKFLHPTKSRAETSLLVMGNPDLGNPTLDLEFAGEEANAISRLFPDTRLLLRQEASETNLRKAGGAFRRLHIASHGSFSAESPLTSGLNLAKDAENDGVLTAGELYSMQINADLVTLSACETGLGKVVNGDDIVGLSRGFLYAGARSIVASLWSVDDRATGQLMQAFYRNLTTMDKLEALRQAQIFTRRSFPHPYFWAAFQLTGKAN